MASRAPSQQKILILLAAWFPVVAYMAAIFLLSSIAIPIPVIDHFPFRDKGVHFLEYALLAFLCLRAARITWPGASTWRVVVLSCAWTVLWGVGDELHQATVFGRSADVRDLGADALGALFANAIAAWFYQRKSR